MTLLQKLVAMQSQLEDHDNDGELDLFIEEFKDDLKSLLGQAINHIGRETK